MTALRSPRYLAGSKGATCKLRIVGVCTGDVETVVPCHARDRHAGGAQKASDLSVIDGCWACHEVFDRRAKMSNGEFITHYEWLFIALRGLQETLEARMDMGLLIVPGDKPKAVPRAPKPRKPKAERKPIPSAKRQWPKRPMRTKP